MSYIALYRKYRPTSFDDVAGQKHIVKTLKNAVIQNRIAHAYLFCGPRGTGKTTIAKIFAKMINCESHEKIPCGICSNCIAIQNGSHPDIIEIDAASNNGVDEVRDLIEKVKYAPMNGKYKVYIIDEVHMMSTGAFNALLKTIEEPPAHVIFIFATTEPQKVLPTIISRCQRYDFTKVSISDMISRLKLVLNQEKIDYEEDAIRLICQLADGGMRDALSILDQVIAYSQNSINLEAVHAIYGVVSVQEKIELLQLVSEKKASECINKVNQFVEKGIDIKRCTSDLIEILKESVIHDYTKNAFLLTTLNEKEVEVSKLGLSTKKRLKMIKQLIETYDKYRFASNVNSYFEVCLLNMMSIENEYVSRETLKESIKVDKKIKEPEQTEKIKIENAQTQELRIIKKLDQEFILSLLVGATKEEKNKDLVKFKTLANYYLNPTWARYANLLRESKLIASSNQYIVVAVNNEAIANEINEQDAQGGFIEFMEVLLLKKKKIYALTEDENTQIVAVFRIRQKEGTLPSAAEISTEESSLDLVKKLFGEENIDIKEN